MLRRTIARSGVGINQVVNDWLVYWATAGFFAGIKVISVAPIVPGAAEGPGARIQESEGRQLRIARQNDFLGFIRCVPDTESSGSLILAPGPSCKASANDFILLEFRSGEQVSTPSSASLRFGWPPPLIPLRRKTPSVDVNIFTTLYRPP